MAQVIVSFKVMPESVETNLDELENKIKSSINPEKISREPIAFGLNSINLTKLVEDAKGEMEKVEKQLREIEGVKGVEITEITRSL